MKRLPFRVVLVTVVALFALEVAVSLFRMISYHSSLQHPHDEVFSMAIVVIAILQSGALYMVYRSLDAEVPVDWRWVAGACGIMAVVSLATANTQVGQGDANAYIGYAKLPAFHQAYAPPRYDFGPGFEVVNRNWGMTIPPADYGPLWLGFTRLTAGGAGSAAQALFIMRLFNIMCIVAIVVLMAKLGYRGPVLTIAAVNPMLWYYYVSEAHNDISAIFLVVLGMFISRKNKWVGAAVAACAGLIKIVFVLIAMVSISVRRLNLTAILQVVLILAIVIFGSLAFGGDAYIRSLAGIGNKQAFVLQGVLYKLGLGLHGLLALCALAAAAAAFWGLFIAPAAYAFSAVAAIIAPWYLGWCLPYALRMPTFIPTFLITLPAVAHLMFDPRRHGGVYADVYYVVILASIAWATWRLFRHQRLPSLRKIREGKAG